MHGKGLDIRNLSVCFHTKYGEVQAVRQVSFSLKPGEILAVVGESGCGKSTLCRSFMQLLPANAAITSGSIFADGIDITACQEKELCKLRGSLFSMVFQDAAMALNPAMTVGAQIAEAVKIHQPKISRTSLWKKVVELMEFVGIENAQLRMRQYPHNFSGGMCQRSVIAVALAGNPSILIADEPTSALDVTVQAQILDLFCRIRDMRQMAVLFVSHDLGVVARVADRVAVMYAGKIVEIGTAEDIYTRPKHPYTCSLMRAMNQYDQSKGMVYTHSAAV